MNEGSTREGQGGPPVVRDSGSSKWTVHHGPDLRRPFRVAEVHDARDTEPDLSLVLLANEGDGRWREVVTLPYPERVLAVRRRVTEALG